MEKRKDIIHKEWSVCRVYDKVLSGEISGFGPHYFCTDKKMKIVTLMKYYIEDLLKITPEEALESLTYEQLEKAKLKNIIKYVEKPIERNTDNKYVKHLIYYAYPKLPKPSAKEIILDCYKRVLSGELKKFPKNYFKSLEGEKRAKVCFEYLCSDLLKIEEKDIPKYFLKTNSKGSDILKKYKLSILTNILYYSVSDMIFNFYPDILNNNK